MAVGAKVVRLLFDCERQILVVYKPEDGSTPQFMGVLASGICGPLRWMAELVDGSSAVKVTGKQPPPLPPQVATISQPSPEPEQGLDEDPSEAGGESFMSPVSSCKGCRSPQRLSE